MNSLKTPEVASTGGSATGNPRNKTALKQGRGLMDWVKLGNSKTDLAGTSGKIVKVTMEELSKHNKRDDAWMAIKGKVFNVTPYFEFHPGGEDELMKGVGMDATALFTEVHMWVNFESILKHCYIGPLVMSKVKPFTLPLLTNPSKENSLKPTSTISSFKLPTFPQIEGGSGFKSKITYDWFQTRCLVNISAYTKCRTITNRHIVASLVGKTINLFIFVDRLIYRIHLDLLRNVKDDFQIKVSDSTGKIESVLIKVEPDIHWPSIGTSLEHNNTTFSDSNMEIEYLKFKVSSKKEVTHDTIHLTFIPLHIVHFGVPIGYHVFLQAPESDISKPYTPIWYPNCSLQEPNYGRQVDIFLKVYEDGILTPKLSELTVGDIISVGIPMGKFSTSMLDRATKKCSYLILFAAGTGITPMTSLLLAALKNRTKTHLIIFNKTERDIPWQNEFHELEESFQDLFKVTHVLSNASESWEGWTGRIRKSLIDQFMPVSIDERKPFVCLCGPKGFTDLASTLLVEYGHSKEDTHVFLG